MNKNAETRRKGEPAVKNREEKVVKSRLNWHKSNEVKKLHIVMTVIAVFLCLSIAAGVFLVWRQFKGEEDMAKKEIAQLVSSALTEKVSSQTPATDFLMLVNSGKKIPDSYKPQLVKFDGTQVDANIVPQLKKMMDAAKSAGYPLKLTGGYVGAKKQEQLYQAEVKRLMVSEKKTQVFAENQALSTIGRSGYNENQTGLAVEFSAAGSEDNGDFSTTKQYHWLVSNCVNYGFVLRYPADKENITGSSPNPSHFRYVGVENALKMREYSMCLEEYVAYLSNRSDS